MRKIFTLTLLLTFMAGSTFAHAPKEPKEKKEKPVDNSKEEKKKAKEEEKAIKDELKAYMKNPQAYKAKMENYRNTIDSDEVQISRLKTTTDDAVAKQSELQSKFTSEDEDLKKLQEENAALKAKTESSTEDAPAGTASTPGTVFKVQLGMYRGFSINKYFNQPRAIGYETVDGMNRYVIGSFPDEKTAQSFVADIRKFGVKDAFVSKYIDGTRVYEWSENPKYKGKKVPNSLEEALQNAAPAKKGKKKNN